MWDGDRVKSNQCSALLGNGLEGFERKVVEIVMVGGRWNEGRGAHLHLDFISARFPNLGGIESGKALQHVLEWVKASLLNF